MFKKLFICLLFLIAVQQGTARKSLQPQNLFDIKWIEDLTLSPDGEWIAFTIKTYTCEENDCNTDIYMVSSRGGAVRQLTTCPGYDGHPVWSSDGSLLAFISDRTGSKQIFILPMEGGEARQHSQFQGNVKKFHWSHDGRYFACLIQAKSEKPEQKTRHTAIEYIGQQHPENPYTFTVLPIDGSHSSDLKQLCLKNSILNLNNSLNFSLSSDGKSILFTELSNFDATMTNLDIYKIILETNKIYTLSQNKAIDMAPVYSPDDKYIAYQTTTQPNHLFDQKEIAVLHTKNNYLEILTTGFDLDICEMVWGPDSDLIYFIARDQGRNAIFSVRIKNKKIKGLLHTGFNTHLTVSPDNHYLYFIRSTADKPPEIYRTTEKGEDLFQLTFLNTSISKDFQFNPVEDLWYPTTGNKLAHGLMMKPADFDPTLKYPLLILLHDGPHDSWNDQFALFWNYQIFLSQGFITAALNVTGSIGYGQTFSDHSKKNWGGSPYKDLLAGTGYLKSHYTFIDENNISLAGEGFGGFLIYWSLTNEIHTDFRCGISYAGIINPVSFYGSTSMPVLPYWEFGGNPQQKNKYYQKWHPVTELQPMQMPILILHGEENSVIPVAQSIEAYTALHINNRPVEFHMYQDEPNILFKPQNIKHWYLKSLEWLSKWTTNL